ncbi:hypothetical protein KsCSTR_26820 [Candidatus Kuenenia stuttgartiensis]|uniref:Uncharacterized protein n=1 Tax=Kuenenia stuttgartiensis TaxID=174633 RepID=A0A6G7GR27_KUEST|nr:hypothetical protein KsCSTR_26820 [Candidatus Kuenenia stuttgartiensis]
MILNNSSNVAFLQFFSGISFNKTISSNNLYVLSNFFHSARLMCLWFYTFDRIVYFQWIWHQAIKSDYASHFSANTSFKECILPWITIVIYHFVFPELINIVSSYHEKSEYFQPVSF